MINAQVNRLLEVKGVGFRFSSASGELLSLVPRLEISKGEIIVILGPNGCGKSTLSKAICGIARSDTKHGQIIPSEYCDPLLVWQSKELFPTSVEMNLSLIGGSSKEIGDILQEFNLLSLRSKPAASLSGGEQQRLVLARALLASRKNRGLVIFDEPDQNLDPDSASLVTDVVRQLCSEAGNAGVIVITHSFQLLRSLGGIGRCRVAVYEKIPFRNNDSMNKSMDVYALHQPVDFNHFLEQPLSPYGAYLLGYENVFCIPNGIEQSFYNLQDPHNMQLDVNYDLFLIPAVALGCSADKPEGKESVRVVKAGLPEMRICRDFSRRYEVTDKVTDDKAKLYLVVAAPHENELPDDGYVYIKDDLMVRRNSQVSELLPLLNDDLDYLMKLREKRR